jgi:hypothetical protein
MFIDSYVFGDESGYTLIVGAQNVGHCCIIVSISRRI